MRRLLPKRCPQSGNPGMLLVHARLPCAGGHSAAGARQHDATRHTPPALAAGGPRRRALQRTEGLGNTSVGAPAASGPFHCSARLLLEVYT
jgi:hypothetical protein